MADYHEIGSLFSKEDNLPNFVSKKWTRYEPQSIQAIYDDTRSVSISLKN